MSTRRQIQVANAIQQHISYLLQRELKDPRIGFATITGVEVTGDLKYARVYVSVMGTPEEQRETMQAMTSGKGFIRRELANRMDIRFVPDLQFKLDTSAAYSDKITRLLSDLKEADVQRGQADAQATGGETDAQTGEEAH
ncbi:MAG: 30S ribosome-binding factor RbfA [Chloroflexi bacterium]|nr:30S ribosome-binding factor RbfA [Chloroflexota bacterium]